MEYTFIKFEQRSGYAIISLNRPDVLNSFNKSMAEQLQHVLDHCSNEKSIRAILLTGEGRAFCAGQDLAEAIAEGGPTISEIVRYHYNPIVKRLRYIEKPIVCAVNGVAAGAGANIAFACDITLSSNAASFIQSFSKIGLIPDSGGTFLLPRLAGLQRATAMMMLADKISAEKALEFGLIYSISTPEKLMEDAIALTVRLAEMPTKSLGYIKQAINRSLTNDLASQLDFEEELQGLAGKTSDYKEGVNAFLEKRKPEFKGE
jgi:2-(1,2-epoxy-1,2-dihydrophenyl)acetyl-CoA isomerase